MKISSYKQIGVSILLALIFVSISFGQSVLAPSGKWVTDKGDMLTSSEERALTNKLEVYAQNTSTQIIIVTLPDLGGQDIALYATELGQSWRVGQDGRDNGAVILVSRDDRKVYIATGYGLEGAIPDAVAGRIIRDVIVPYFREGSVYRGLSSAVDHLVSSAGGEYLADGSSSTQTSRQRSRSSGNGVGRFIFLIILIIFSILGGGRGKGRRRSGGVYPIFFGGGGGFSSGGGFGGGGFGGFSGGGGGFGGGGAGGSW